MPRSVGQVELIECAPSQDGATYEASFRVENSSGGPINVELGFEILNAGGERLGTGGNTSDTVPAGGEATISGFAAGFTVLDINDATDCAVLSATVI